MHNSVRTWRVTCIHILVPWRWGNYWKSKFAKNLNFNPADFELSWINAKLWINFQSQTFWENGKSKLSYFSRKIRNWIACKISELFLVEFAGETSKFHHFESYHNSESCKFCSLSKVFLNSNFPVMNPQKLQIYQIHLEFIIKVSKPWITICNHSTKL